jgi:hypothetical protein
MFLVGPTVFSVVVKGVKVIFWTLLLGLEQQQSVLLLTLQLIIVLTFSQPPAHGEFFCFQPKKTRKIDVIFSPQGLPCQINLLLCRAFVIEMIHLF